MAARLRWLLVAVALLAAISFAWAEVAGKSAQVLEVKSARTAETGVGDLVADAVRAQFSADVALLPAGLLRTDAAPLPAGELTREQLTKPLFFPDEPVVLVEMPGARLQAALERSLSFLPQPSVSFLQVSGLAVTYRLQAPANHRIVRVLVNGTPLAPQQRYRVAMPDSMARGNPGYFRVFDGLTKRQTGPALGDALFRYVQARGTITLKPGDRLREAARP